ncbi:YlqD family protein [Bacillus sp. FJAT-45350]|uniref:YlqD family protein n=1 Tax=Bacillus sp. FJAT-45350 TaxID=2011014 RepID=UPI000BB67B2D|nr:YlqD family protein [Bacillus sp. FJAT-45350]
MDIIRTVTVKQILTEKRKQYLMNELSNEEVQVSKELEQLKFQLHKKLKKFQSDHEYSQTIRQSFNSEIKQRQEKLRAVEFKKHQLNKLEIGTELKDGSVQSICSIQVGDNWDDVLRDTEVIIRDGIVDEIRKGLKKDDKLV